MTDATETAPDPQAEGQEQIDSGSYELLRNRLVDQSKALGQKADTLNEKRIEIFGGTEMTIGGTQRIRTENNCVPRDIIAIGNDLLFLGYNVALGLRREVSSDDVFDVYKFEEIEGGFEFTKIPEADERNFLDQPKFIEDFQNLYRYMKDSRLVQLRDFHTKMLAVFQVGSTIKDIKAFRWDINTKVWPNTVHYVDDNGAREHVFPPAHDFAWQTTGRDDFVFGTHPHVNINDKVFVETVGGDLTIKVDDNTEDGQGIYSEPVENADQALDDAKIFYAELGTLILLKILPFNETTWRYLVFNTRNDQVNRIDAIGRSCVQLPEDHGLIFPGGYYLRSGETKSFEGDVEGMIYKGVTKSPNGEDVLYVFYEEDTGRSILLPYNLIRKVVQNPIHCHGYTLFDDGRMVVFRYDSEDASRVHPVQIWQTPFVTDEWAVEHSVESEHSGSFLVKVGNKDLVRGISDCHSVRKMIQGQEPSTNVYEDLVAACTRLFDAHFWLGDDEVGNITETVKEIRSTAELIIDEFEKVQFIQKAAREALADAEKKQEDLLKDIRPEIWTTVDQFVDAMGLLNKQRGHLITLKEMRYINTARIDEMETVVGENFEMLTERAVEFLLGEDALKPYHDKYDELMVKIGEIQQSNEAVPIQEDLDTNSENLDLLTEVISGLHIEDPAARTRILEDISEVFALFNRAKATLAGRRKDMLSEEGVAEFGAQFKLFAQAVQSAIAMSDTPEKCEEQLTRLMVQLEEIEARFSEFDQFLGDISQKREEVYDALNAKKQQLLDERQRRAENISSAADRILQGIGRRAAAFKAIEDLNAYFASDAMILKVRDLAEQLNELGDSMRSEQVIAKLRSSRDGAARSLRDKTELFEEGENIIRLGKHRFAVNVQDLEITMLPRDGVMNLNLTGTNFFEAIEDKELDEAKIYWDQTLISETPDVYRGEYLASCMLFDAEAGKNDLSLDRITEAQIDETLLALVREYASSRYDEGYERGVHDSDAALILDRLMSLRKTSGLLRFGPTPRSFACLFWANLVTLEGGGEAKALTDNWTRTGKNLGRLRDAFASTETLAEFAHGFGESIGEFLADNDIDHHSEDARIAGLYLAEELAEEPLAFALSGESVRLRDRLFQHLDLQQLRAALEQDLDALAHDLPTRYAVALAWCEGFIAASDRDDIKELQPVVRETAVLLLTEGILRREESGALSTVQVEGVLGQHARIGHQQLTLRLDEFLERLSTYGQVTVPGYRAYRELRSTIIERERYNLRLEEFKPKVLTSFVRNKLINDVYLHMVGDNLAKQMGAAGDAKRTDLMGMLLLISPPGYGKTTLMEYIANRLGLVFMKINGPALGHSVESLDPDEAPNATARQELQKLNLALEMGNNVMLYVDDIQHTNPEFLQKFISLCDAQRRIEGVWKGRTRTYDLRGRRFCVCMAGNPYTESGDKFQIPDMLANRADVYNLGDVLTGREDAFALSYIENSITSNHVLAPLATREQADIYTLVRMAQGEEVPASELKHNLSKVEIEEIVNILKKLFVCRDVLLKVNGQYIASAAQDDRFRTEPRFQLQGSYRNMNKLGEKVVSAMNEAELTALVDDHYIGEAQTLTTGAESNLLKLKEMLGRQSPEEAERWDDIKRGFARHQLATGDDDDPVTRVTNQLSALNENIHGVRDSIVAAGGGGSASAATSTAGPSIADALLPEIGNLRAAIEKVATSAATGEAATTAVGTDVSPYLAELNEVLKAMAKKPAEGAPPPAASSGTAELAPYLEQLNGVLETLAQPKPEPEESSAAADMAPYLQQLNQVLRYLAQAQKPSAQGAAPAPGITEDQFKQLAVVRNTLRSVLEEAQARLKDEDQLSAAKVWKQLSQAMEMLESIR